MAKKRKKRNRSEKRRARVTESVQEPSTAQAPKIKMDEVFIMGITRKKLEEMWNRVNDMTIAMIGIPDTYERFCKVLLDPLTVILEVPDLRAVYYMTGTNPGGNGDVHLIIWDKALLGQRELYLGMLKKIMDDFNLRRVTAIIPTWNNIAQNLARKIGFKREGLLREWVNTNGQPDDVVVYGLLKRELEEVH